ncbi:hypothetical protein [Rubrolithibacter danxiaensis]|uniref:hypothetical protein n=1 Tax=Rubrolithibacter danxiaensis TaxID=3390805 RepID=UPI003BF86C9A
MQDQKPTAQYPVEENFSFKELITNRKDDFLYLWSKRPKLFIALIIGAVLGALLAWKWPVTYTARLTFVVEESKPGGGSIMSALAGQFGFDLGSLSGTGGVLAGDNVQELLHSHKLIKNTLLTNYSDSTGKTLADRYAEVYNLKKKWAKYSNNIRFPANDSAYTRLQDSLLSVIIKRINEKELGISKPDKKLSFFELTSTMRDEKVAALFCRRLLDKAADFYTSTKTKRLRINVEKLQGRADSISKILNKKTYSASAANQILLDINPAYPTANVNQELQERDKLVLSTIYSEVIKNLEVSKTMLAQETPTFQVVDEPEYPLKKNELKYWAAIGLGIVVAVFLYSLYLLSIKKQ